MDVFWDTSAMVALLLQEPSSAAARAAWTRTSRAWAWRWAVMEAEAALSRRKAPPSAWSQWAVLQGSLRLLDLDPAHWEALRAFNRGLRLRAADAAHVFVCERAATAVPRLNFITFDTEQAAAARSIGLSVL